METPRRAQKILEKSNDPALVKEYQEQQSVLSETEAVLNRLYDDLLDAERQLEEDSADDVYGIGEMKRRVKVQLDKLVKWQKKEQTPERPKKGTIENWKQSRFAA